MRVPINKPYHNPPTPATGGARQRITGLAVEQLGGQCLGHFWSGIRVGGRVPEVEFLVVFGVAGSSESTSEDEF